MNSADINLVNVGGIPTPKNSKAVKLKIIAVAFLIFVGAMAVILFILDFYSPLNSIKKEQDQILTSISSQNDKAAKLSIVNERAVAINKLKTERTDYLGVLDIAISNLSSGVRTAGLSVDKASVAITVSSDSLLSLNNFLNGVLDESKKNDSIKSVSMESLTATDVSNIYLMSVKFSLK